MLQKESNDFFFIVWDFIVQVLNLLLYLAGGDKSVYPSNSSYSLTYIVASWLQNINFDH